MFKNKAFLSGLGIGLIVGAILLQLMNSVPNPSDQSLIPADQEQTNINDQPENADDAASEKPEEPPEPVVQHHWGFTIAQGTRAKDIADMLHEMKLVDDNGQFLNELKAAMRKNYIYEGYYVFEEKPDHQEIIRKIMKLD